MWHGDYHQRLLDWARLRDQCGSGDLENALLAINDWWFQTPWRPYYLHWDDHFKWPDAWQILSDNIFCDLARGLGILYTIQMIDRDDITAVSLAQTSQGNLVLVNEGKYILNWSKGELLNIASTKFTITKTLDRVRNNHLTG